MKKLAILFCVIALVLVGCKSKTDETVVPADAAKTILDSVTFRDTLMEANGDIARDRYVLDDKVSEIAVYMSGSGATAEEIAVIKSTDVKTAKTAVEKRVDDLKFNFENYVPAEMTKLGDPVIVTRGDVVFLVICDDPAQAKKVIDGLF